MRALLFAFTLCTVAGAVGAAEKFSSSNVDVRTVISFKASEAAVQKVLPSGWVVASPTSGPLKGFNVSINFIETITAQDAEGKSVPVFRGAVLAVPAKKAGSQDTGVFVFTGLVGPESVPGAYGVYVPAKAAIERKVRSESAEKSDVEENWNFRSEDGSAIVVELRMREAHSPGANQKRRSTLLQSRISFGFIRWSRPPKPFEAFLTMSTV